MADTGVVLWNLLLLKWNLNSIKFVSGQELHTIYGQDMTVLEM